MLSTLIVATIALGILCVAKFRPTDQQFLIKVPGRQDVSRTEASPIETAGGPARNES